MKPNDCVKYVGGDWAGIIPVGVITIVSPVGIKVLWDNIDWAYSYYKSEDLEVISEDEYRRLLQNPS